MVAYKSLFPKIIGLWVILCIEQVVKSRQTSKNGQKWSKMVVFLLQFGKNGKILTNFRSLVQKLPILC